ncbi:hypothetical protein ACOMHN_033272 [Nucella lapillus]
MDEQKATQEESTDAGASVKNGDDSNKLLTTAFKKKENRDLKRASVKNGNDADKCLTIIVNEANVDTPKKTQGHKSLGEQLTQKTAHEPTAAGASEVKNGDDADKCLTAIKNEANRDLKETQEHKLLDEQKATPEEPPATGASEAVKNGDDADKCFTTAVKKEANGDTPKETQEHKSLDEQKTKHEEIEDAEAVKNGDDADKCFTTAVKKEANGDTPKETQEHKSLDEQKTKHEEIEDAEAVKNGDDADKCFTTAVKKEANGDTPKETQEHKSLDEQKTEHEEIEDAGSEYPPHDDTF